MAGRQNGESASARASFEGDGWRRNRLLSAMPASEQARLAPDLQLVDLDIRQLLHEADEPIRHVYFPLDCVVSQVAIVEQGTQIEVATIGSEGMVGLPAFLGAGTSPNRTFCQVPGQALRLDVEAMHRHFVGGDGALHKLVHRYIQAVMVFLAQNGACNRIHDTEERCARWLLQTHDRVGRDVFPLTQEFLGQMLGVRRATVSLSARVLQHAGLIRYARGRITILDRTGLTRAACDCYAIVRREFDKLAPHQI